MKYGTQRRVAGGEWSDWTTSDSKESFERLVKLVGGHEDKVMLHSRASHMSLDTPEGLVEFRIFTDGPDEGQEAGAVPAEGAG